MIGTIRKHSAWLWWIVAGLTIISFVIFMGQGGTRYGGGRYAGLGAIYGKPVTAEEFSAAQREFLVLYWMRSHEFPKSPGFSKTDLEKETYVRLMLTAKAKALGIHANLEAQQLVATNFLTSLGREGQAVPMSTFLERILQPEGLDAADFQRAIADNLAIAQLQQTLGLPGALITPQEVGQVYDREHQEFSAQAVFFAASNYVSQVAVTPAAISLFYSNFLAYYRLPDRVQLNYLEYDLTNFLAAAEQKLGKTNIASQAEMYYSQKGAEAVPDAKTPEEAKAKLRDMILRQSAAAMAGDQAKQFLNTLFAMDPALPENLVALARTNGLTVHTTAPFSEAEGPIEFPASADLAKAAFKLTAESPFWIKPIAEAEAVYVIGLKTKLPSEIQPLTLIHDRVVADYKNYEATAKARTAGTNFYFGASVQMAAGKTFAQAALAAGQTPQVLKPFSLSSQAVPEAEGHAELNQLKNAAFTTKPGHVSQFVATAEGGFVLFVQSMLPVDEAAKNTELPRFLAQQRRSRESEAFSLWLETEANRELKNTPVYADLMGNKAAPRSP